MTPLADYMADCGYTVCPRCNGCGVVVAQPCRTCGGYGVELEVEDFEDECVIIALEDMSVNYEDVLEDLLDVYEEPFSRYCDELYDKMMEDRGLWLI